MQQRILQKNQNLHGISYKIPRYYLSVRHLCVVYFPNQLSSPAPYFIKRVWRSFYSSVCKNSTHDNNETCRIDILYKNAESWITWVREIQFFSSLQCDTWSLNFRMFTRFELFVLMTAVIRWTFSIGILSFSSYHWSSAFIEEVLRVD